MPCSSACRPPPAAFTAAELRQGLVNLGQTTTTELFAVVQFGDGTGLAGPFGPSWTFDPTPPSPPPSPPRRPPPPRKSPPPPRKNPPPPRPAPFVGEPRREQGLR